MKKIGFIGCGNMAGAIIGGLVGNHLFAPEEIIGSDAITTVVENISMKYGITMASNNAEVVEECEVLVLSVKPQFYENVITEIKDLVRPEQIIITIAPGKTLQWLQDTFGKECKIVRCMPNTPALVGEGITGACASPQVTGEEAGYVKQILGSFGKVEFVGEGLMDVVTAVSGSSPAYVFMFIEAMADAAVADGMPRAQAYTFAAQAVLGSAKMVLETGTHPAELKDMVCSPGGTTIEAVGVLEKNGFRSAVIEGVRACTKKSKGI